MKNRLQKILEREHQGKDNAIVSRALEERLGCKGTMIREMVNELRNAGVPICSDRNGYYIAKSREELDRTIVQLKRFSPPLTDWKQSECERKVITMMTSREFRRLVVAVSNGYAAADKRVDAGNREEFLRHGKWALGVLKRYFHDTDRNIERWLQGEKCVFLGAATKAPTEIQIGNDLEAFFYFMQFYKMQKEDRKPDEDFIDYMALLITRSQSKEWEEC